MVVCRVANGRSARKVSVRGAPCEPPMMMTRGGCPATDGRYASAVHRAAPAFRSSLAHELHAGLTRPNGQAASRIIPTGRVAAVQLGLDPNRACGRATIPQPLDAVSATRYRPPQIPRGGCEQAQSLDEVRLPCPVGPDQPVQGPQLEGLRSGSERKETVEPELLDHHRTNTLPCVWSSKRRIGIVMADAPIPTRLRQRIVRKMTRVQIARQP